MFLRRELNRSKNNTYGLLLLLFVINRLGERGRELDRDRKKEREK